MSTDTMHSPTLFERVQGEFNEMPGLRVTERQAQRLWGLDALTCHLALEYLIDAHFLCHTNGGQYARASEGAAAFPSPRMLKTSLARRRAAS